MKMKFKSFLLMLLFLFAGSAMLSAAEYWQVVNEDRYRRMSQFERVQYDKAMQLLRDRNYRAAANEFERFLIQYKESEVIPYVKFMQAYALHLAKDRNKAIGVYNEVLDFFGGEIDAAAPAMYYRGVAQFDNGDYTKGMTTMKELLDDPDYSKHSVAAPATLKMVENYWKNKEPEKAETYLKRIFKDHKGTPAAEDAKHFYMASCAATGKMSDYASWYFQAYKEDALKKKIKASQLNVNMVSEMFTLVLDWDWRWLTNEQLMKYRGGKKGPDPARELWKLFEDNKKNFEKADRQWEYYRMSIDILARRKLVSDAEFDKRVSGAVEVAKKTPDDEKNKGRQQKRICELVDYLFYRRQWDRGAYVNTNVKDEKTRAWNDYRYLEGQGKWEDALKELDGIEKKYGADAKMMSKCGWARAGILHHRMREYDNAIKVYRSIGEPPRTLWNIADCYKLKKDSKMAVQTYLEIANSFDKEAPEAYRYIAAYYNQIGDKKRSIATSRYILKQFPKSSQASWAHQHLESLGVEDTGLGAGVDEDF